jgi:serine/threonine-protein kinase
MSSLASLVDWAIHESNSGHYGRVARNALRPARVFDDVARSFSLAFEVAPAPSRRIVEPDSIILMRIEDSAGASRILGGAWRVESEIGRGGTAIVYAATHVREGTRGALKLLSPALSNDPKVVKMLLSEARSVAAIDHPGTVAVLDEGVADDGCAFLVFELLVGQTLEELRQGRGGRVPLEEMMPIGDAVMDALGAVHEAGVVHRDIKPSNIFVLEGGGVKLLDFGFAKLRGYTADAAQNLFGTPSYMPPEQAFGLAKKVDAQSDVWALGATLFHALSGQSVHIAEDVTAMLLATRSARPRSLAEAAPELSSKVIAVVDRALSYLKAERWPDMPAMRSAWQEAHPHWLATLPPPRFTADPAFIDSSLLEDAARTSTRPLFDPRELLNDSMAKAPVLPAGLHPAPLPRSGPPTHGSRRPSRLPHLLIVIAGALFLAFVVASVLR